MDKYYKLALVVRAACNKAVEYAKEGSKEYLVHVALGHTQTDAEPDCLIITDEDGYRSIHLGDERLVRSYDTGKWDPDLFNKGCVYLYRESSNLCDKDGRRIWVHNSFPSADALYYALKLLAMGEYNTKQVLMTEKTRDLDIKLNSNNDLEETKKYLSGVVERFADLAWNDPRSAEEITAQ